MNMESENSGTNITNAETPKKVIIKFLFQPIAPSKVAENWPCLEYKFRDESYYQRIIEKYLTRGMFLPCHPLSLSIYNYLFMLIIDR